MENGEDTQQRVTGWEWDLRLLQEDNSFCVWAVTPPTELSSSSREGSVVFMIFSAALKDFSFVLTAELLLNHTKMSLIRTLSTKQW